MILEYLTLKQVSEIYNISLLALRKRVERDSKGEYIYFSKDSYFKVGNTWIIKRKEVEQIFGK
jgi:hypothetical protein